MQFIYFLTYFSLFTWLIVLVLSLESGSDAEERLNGWHAPQTSHLQISFFGELWKSLFIDKSLVPFRNWKLKLQRSFRKLISISFKRVWYSACAGYICEFVTRKVALNIASKTASLIISPPLYIASDRLVHFSAHDKQAMKSQWHKFFQRTGTLSNRHSQSYAFPITKLLTSSSLGLTVIFSTYHPKLYY